MVLPVLCACKPAPKCDAQEDARYAWLETPNALRPDRAIPKALGIRLRGSCVTTISEKQVACGDDFVKSWVSDNPYLRQARELGFTTYRCEPIDGSKSVEIPIGE